MQWTVNNTDGLISIIAMDMNLTTVDTNLLPLQAPIPYKYMFQFTLGLCLQKLQLAKLEQEFLGNPR